MLVFFLSFGQFPLFKKRKHPSRMGTVRFRNSAEGGAIIPTPWIHYPFAPWIPNPLHPPDTLLLCPPPQIPYPPPPKGRETRPPVDRQTPVKTLSSRNFVGGW